MAEKILNSRMIQKHDIEENWEKAVNFIPKQGEIIIYDIDNNYDYERIKVGDGTTTVSALPFSNEILLEEDINEVLNMENLTSENLPVTEYVRYTVQTLTEAEKKQAQDNIGVTVESNHWAGKTWYAYGTSLTSETQGKYVPYVAELSGLNVVNKGIPGGALVANRNIFNALMSTTDGKIDADLITIEVGANDASTPIGDISGTDTDTFCGALNTCLQNIMTNCPKAQIVLMPSTRGRTAASNGEVFALDSERPGGGTYEEYHEAIRRVAVANGVYFIPFGSGLGLGLYRMQASNLYNVDNIHHTNLGGYNLAQGIWAYLQNIPLWYNTLPEAEV